MIAASVDLLNEARKTVERDRLAFPVAFGLDARDFATRTGAFFDAEGRYLQAAGFLLAPAGRVATAVYSTSAIGRLTAADTLGLIDYLTSKRS